MLRWGSFVAGHRWWFLLGWLVLIIGAGALYPSFTANQAATDYSVQGSESRHFETLVDEEFPGLAGEQDVVVFETTEGRVDEPTAKRRIAGMLQTLDARDDVSDVVPPFATAARAQVSDDGTAAIALVAVQSGDLSEATDRIQGMLDGAVEGSEMHAFLVGETPINDAVIDSEYASSETAEAIGVPIAFVVCLLATGALVSALLPIGLGIITVTLSFGVLGAAGNLVTLDGILSSVVPMIGLGVGIDYALFVTSRFREELHPARVGGRRPTRAQVDRAVAVAIASSGLTIAFSGVVVMFSLLSLVLIPARTFQQLALGMSLTVGCALFAGLTLLPASLAVLGHRVERGGLPWRRRVVAPGGNEGHGLLGRLARALMRRPFVAATVAVVALLIVASPALGLRLGLDMGVEGLGDVPAAQGQRVLADKFSPSIMMPIQVIYTASGDRLTKDDVASVDQLSRRFEEDNQVSSVVSITTEHAPSGSASSAPLVSADGRRTHLSVISSIAPDDPRAVGLVERIRGELSHPAEVDGAQVLVGGVSAEFHDLSRVTSERLWLVVSLVLVLSFFFLVLVFRSLVLPLKAIAMNLLATVASYGALVWVFQQGHLAGLFDFTPKGTIQTYLPLVLFALLFGLSMDYEIFLVRRIQEEWRRSGDNTHAVAVGLEHTGLQITAAAGIMVAVFGAFVTASVLELKQIGFAFAFAVLIDATIIRLVLVPALMRLTGRYNWWLPHWLERRLPRLDLD